MWETLLTTGPQQRPPTNLLSRRLQLEPEPSESLRPFEGVPHAAIICALKPPRQSLFRENALDLVNAVGTRVGGQFKTVGRNAPASQFMLVQQCLNLCATQPNFPLDLP